MTVGRVYWHFDAMADYLRKTNPFGSGEDETQTIEPCRVCGELEGHFPDCPEQNKPQRPRRTVDKGTREHASGFDFGAKMAQSNIPVRPGIDVANGIDEVRARDAFLADLLEDADRTLPKEG